MELLTSTSNSTLVNSSSDVIHYYEPVINNQFFPHVHGTVQLENLYSSIKVDRDSKIILDWTDPLHHLYDSSEEGKQIKYYRTSEKTFETWPSAYKLWACVRVIRLKKPELIEAVKESAKPRKTAFVDMETYMANADRWQIDYQIKVAYIANWLKFVENKFFGEMLCETGNAELVSPYAAPWGCDGQFAVSDGPDMNYTGKILMTIRDILQNKMGIDMKVIQSSQNQE